MRELRGNDPHFTDRDSAPEFARRRRSATGDSELRLQAALRDPGCPICQAGRGTEAQWLELFLYEGYQAPEALARVTSAPGFCSHHGELLVTFSARSAAIAHIHAATLARLSDESERDEVWGRSSVPATQRAGRAPSAVTCAACEHVRADVERNAYFLSLVLKDLEPEAYGNPGLVCMQHLAVLQESLDARMLPSLLTTHAKHLDNLILKMPLLRGATHDAIAVSDLRQAARSETQHDADALQRTLSEVLGEPTLPKTQASITTVDRQGAIADPEKRLRARLAEGSCALCDEMVESQTHWLHWLNENSVLRADIHDVLPTCPEHAWLAFRGGTVELQNILVRHVLEQARAQIKRATHWSMRPSAGLHNLPLLGSWFARRSAAQAVREILRQPPRCPFCESLRAVRQQTTRLLGTLLVETATRQALEQGSGLCARHTVQAVAQLGTVSRESELLAGLMRVKFSAMRWQLSEMLRKTSWDARAEPQGDEMFAWRRAIRFVSGRMT